MTTKCDLPEPELSAAGELLGMLEKENAELRRERDEHKFYRALSDEALGIIRGILGKDNCTFVDDGVQRVVAQRDRLTKLLEEGLRRLAGHALHCAHLGTDPEQADGSDYDDVCDWMDLVRKEIG